ncbi:uncharacterized protein I303_107919 [Kwoniella dejecticola CBS 10117]|uniref:Uncharacterized protein n=1 Tax=Kwoniella dejecticola CBS 10117 TaxID=1296121 RepID=A0AAJ8MLC5_9TREE
MFYGAVSDFFAQAVITFLLGHRNLSVFSEFLETMTSADAASVVKLSRIRAVANSRGDICCLLQLLARKGHGIHSNPVKLYYVGAESLHAKNYGFVINFSPTNESTRYSTYSLRNKLPSVPQTAPETPQPSVEHASINPDITEFYAFKAMPGHTGEDGTCQEMVNHVVEQIAEVYKTEDLVVQKDIVSLAEAESSTSILDKMDYAFKRFLWL